MNYRRGLHRVFLFFAVLWIIGVFTYPLYTSSRSNQINTQAFHECMTNHNDDAGIQLCEKTFKIETDYGFQFLSLNYYGEGLAFNIAVALLTPLLAYGAIRLTIAIVAWLRRGFLAV